MTQVLWPEIESGYARKILLAVTGSLLLALSAKIQITVLPVPLTLQTLAVIMIGTLFGPRLGVATVMLYLAEGMAGLPVFAGPLAGPAYFAGPTGGFLIGFVPAAWLAGTLAERGWDRRIVTTFALMILSAGLIYIPGAAWLATLIGAESAIAKGVLPFLLGDVIKAALATAVLPLAWKLIK
ncbi:MAG: biotin transporter BioY [Hyphomicrobiales bacterium]|nr:MAG: biotin transporter BioY [Hyphomicrobiales bacterium]